MIRQARQLSARRRVEQRAQRLVALCFGATMLAGGALVLVYILGSNTIVEGLLLMVALGGLGVGIIIWSHDLLPQREVVEQRGRLASAPADVVAIREELTGHGEITRRTLLVRMLMGAVAALGGALAIPIFSLGPAPGSELFRTAWRSGLRLVTVDGTPVSSEAIPVGGILTVFPEGQGHPGDTAAVLINVGPNELDLPAGEADWAPQGFVCYSKLCTHAGCPVGLYVVQRQVLLCPCHQSEFDVLRGALPVAGPAARPLPQLPIQLQPDGTFVAAGDFEGPVGPSFWDVHQ